MRARPYSGSVVASVAASTITARAVTRAVPRDRFRPGRQPSRHESARLRRHDLRSRERSLVVRQMRRADARLLQSSRSGTGPAVTPSLLGFGVGGQLVIETHGQVLGHRTVISPHRHTVAVAMIEKRQRASPLPLGQSRRGRRQRSDFARLRVRPAIGDAEVIRDEGTAPRSRAHAMTLDEMRTSPVATVEDQSGQRPRARGGRPPLFPQQAAQRARSVEDSSSPDGAKRYATYKLEFPRRGIRLRRPG